MAVFAPIAEFGFVHIGVTAHARCSLGWLFAVALVVTVRAFDVGVSVLERETRMEIAVDVVDVDQVPVGLVVARGALFAETIFMRVFVTAHAVTF